MTLTLADYFCGAGGSSSGAEQVPGVKVRMAANHWDLAIATHNANLPHADHDVADIAQIDPRRHPKTDIGWFSPECTNWSIAKGVKQTYDGRPVPLELGEEYTEPLPDEAAHRSRMLMQDVPRFTEVHRYRAVLVENVTDVLKWEHLDEWLTRMDNLGYDHQIVILNSAFAAALGAGAPQLRDRAYFVFWQTRYRQPDFVKWTRPRAFCTTCGDVRGVYTAKPGKRRAMRYGKQYDFRCPNWSCRGALVQPYVLPAAAAIDWTLQGQRIGDRAKPLQPKTLARIEAGLRRYTQPITIEAAGHFERPADQPLTVLHTTISQGLACPPLLVPCGGGLNTTASSAGAPLRTRTTRETEGIACPPFPAPLRSDRPRTNGIGEPPATVDADGGNHALIEPMLVPVEGRDGKQVRPISVPFRAQTARHENALVVPLRNNGVARPAGQHPLITFAAGGTHQGLLYGYDTGTLRPLGVPLPTQTSIQGDALLGAGIAVDDCTFRMLGVDEIRAGMAFTPGYILLGNKREQVRMLGNAVTPPSARDLVAAVVEAITGEDLELAA